MKTSFQGMSNYLRKLNIPLEEVTEDLDDLKMSLDEAAQAEDIEVKSLMEVNCQVLCSSSKFVI